MPKGVVYQFCKSPTNLTVDVNTHSVDGVELSK